MFNEKQKEWSAKQGKEIDVFQSPRYLEAKDKAIELINSKKYDLVEGDFWILMNETKSGKMMYSGLIISHNGCLKINDKLENRVDPSKFSLDKEGYAGSLTFTYIDDEVYEVGEVSAKNCKNDYPYAMAFKRCFDRVVLKKCKLAYSGVYSDSEADEFKEKPEEKPIVIEVPKPISDEMEAALRDMISNLGITDVKVKEALKKRGYRYLKQLKENELNDFREELSK